MSNSRRRTYNVDGGDDMGRYIVSTHYTSNNGIAIYDSYEGTIDRVTDTYMMYNGVNCKASVSKTVGEGVSSAGMYGVHTYTYSYRGSLYITYLQGYGGTPAIGDYLCNKFNNSSGEVYTLIYKEPGDHEGMRFNVTPDLKTGELYNISYQGSNYYASKLDNNFTITEVKTIVSNPTYFTVHMIRNGNIIYGCTMGLISYNFNSGSSSTLLSDSEAFSYAKSMRMTSLL